MFFVWHFFGPEFNPTPPKERADTLKFRLIPPVFHSEYQWLLPFCSPLVVSYSMFYNRRGRINITTQIKKVYPFN